jgi:hypothetical protein
MSWALTHPGRHPHPLRRVHTFSSHNQPWRALPGNGVTGCLAIMLGRRAVESIATYMAWLATTCDTTHLHCCEFLPLSVIKACCQQHTLAACPDGHVAQHVSGALSQHSRHTLRDVLHT